MVTVLDQATPSERIQKLRKRLLSSPIEVDIERAHYYTKVWREMEDSTPCMRKVRALEETLCNMTIKIEDDEIIVGVRTARSLATVMPVERHPINIADEGNSRRSRRLARAGTAFTKEEHRELEEDILPYWRDRTARSLKHKLWRQEGLYDEEYSSLIPYEIGIILDTQGHVIPGFRRVLKLGFKGITEWAERQLHNLKAEDEDYEHRRDFLKSVPIVAKAVCDYSNRYAKLAEDMAKKAEGKRKTELLEVAKRCKHVPAEPARNFIEALQSLWLTQVALCISYGLGDVFSTGRIDQYLHPYYMADLEAGIITPEEAYEAIEEYHLKLATTPLPANYTITLGGLDKDGEDATNEISYMFLNAVGKLGAFRNNVSVRVSPKTPHDFLVKAWETHRIGAGVAFFNDEIIVRDLLEDGYALEDARDYSIVGCVEPTSTGKDFSYTAGNAVMLTRVLELAINGGCLLSNDNRLIGAPTPPAGALKTFEDIIKAFEEQLCFCIDKCTLASELKDRVYAEHYPSPLLSSTIEGCLESGKDITRGGAIYNNGHMGMQALATVVNSLLAIRWAVYEHRLLTLAELLQHVRNNFEGAATLRQQLMRKAPKYGNDDRNADEIADWIVEIFCREVRKYECGRGGVYRPLILSSGFQIYEGALCGATPDGRLAGEAVTDGISPAHGTELNGLTAVLQSAANAGKALVSDGTTLTLNLSPGLLRTGESVDKLASLIRGYFQLGGRHVQFTPVSTDTLKDAQSHPEKHPDLVVKVSGYSALFVDLPSVLQNDIIARTEFSQV